MRIFIKANSFKIDIDIKNVLIKKLARMVSRIWNLTPTKIDVRDQDWLEQTEHEKVDPVKD